MNSSAITGQADYDYRFITYLINEVFAKEVLAQSSVYQSHQSGKKIYHALDKVRYSFVQDIFKERIQSDTKRFKELPKHVNKRCSILRQNLKNKK